MRKLPGEEVLASSLLEDEAATQKIRRLSTAERIELASKASSQERLILAQVDDRDVAIAVLANPKLTTDEVAVISGMKSTSAAVMLQISSSPRWTKNRLTVLNAARHPKTPFQLAMAMLHGLGYRELRTVASDPFANPAVREMAAQMVALARGETPEETRLKHS